jgi:predicted TPR repeat methyltransferase
MARTAFSAAAPPAWTRDTAALLQAVECLRGDRLAEADAVLSALCTHEPVHPDALHFQGVLRHLQGRTSEGIALIRAALAVQPDNGGAHNNLGNLLLEAGDADEAMASYRRGIECAATPRQAADAWANLGGLLRRAGFDAEAQDACRHAIDAHPAHGTAWFVLSRSLAESGEVAESVQAYAQAVLLLPRDQVGRAQVLRALMLKGERAQAAAMLHDWLAQAPGDPVATHMLHACEGRTPPRASDDYVAQIFDAHADSFDASLERLHYRAPALVARAVESALGPAAGALDVVDAGCGTGLVGPLIRPWARRLAGCDLSVGMLRQARRRGGYDLLHQAELTYYLATQPGAFDLAVSADTLCYFGDLHEPLAAAARALRPGGWLVFTVEASEAPDAGGAPFRLELSGRYTHSCAHVHEALAASGFGEIVIEAAVPRHEAGREVAGWLARARRAP